MVAGIVLVAVAFLAAGRVADTREGMVFEVITLLAGLAGVCLVLYGLFASTGQHGGAPSTRMPVVLATPPEVRSANDLLLGATGLLIAMVLIIGIALSTGPLWALLGVVLLLPMVTGCAYLCFRFIRAPEREWRIDLQRLTRHR
ncbi:MAG TPA: hypothetical protein VGU71_05190 [Candidatus Dormibacteraeota bacterium]|nr:hypothetical protein [Candidatus Dormibacteraeota bacterium]